jgi:hypothetical protein
MYLVPRLAIGNEVNNACKTYRIVTGHSKYSITFNYYCKYYYDVYLEYIKYVLSDSD